MTHSLIHERDAEMPLAIDTKKLTRQFKLTSYGKFLNMGDSPGSLLEAAALRILKRTSVNHVTAVDNVTLQVAEGEFLGILGPNGSGKSTLLKILAGLIYPSSGEATILGYNLWKDREKIASCTNFIPGILTGGAWIDPSLTAKRNLQSVAELFGLPPHKVEEALVFSGLKEFAEVRVGTFSSGMSARLQLAFSLMRESPLFLLDEPTEGISPEAVKEIRDHIVELNRKAGVTVLYATHHVLEAQAMFTKVAIMDRGKIAVIDTVSSLIKSLGEREALTMEVSQFHPALESQLSNLDRVSDFACDITDRVSGRATVRMLLQDSRTVLADIVDLTVKAANCKIHHITLSEPNLEDVYLHYTGRRIA